MEKIKQEIIKLTLNMQDPKGILIPRGLIETLTCEIADEAAIFYFKNPQITKRFALLEIALEKKKGKDDTKWIERLQKAVTKYPGMKKEAIRNLLLEQFKTMGLNAK
jgi:hypothetical protein